LLSLLNMNKDLSSRVYISTAIDYVNAAPHLGHALEKVQADSLARYFRQQEKKVFFLSGTDENGLKIVQAAKAAGLANAEFVKKNADNFYALKSALNLTYDDFIRTTEKRHALAVQKFWKKIKKDIYKKKYKGFYCTGCESYIKPADLRDGLCPIHHTQPEEIEEENYFFKLSSYQKELKKIITDDKIKIIPEERKNEVLGFIKGGLEDFCISRSQERASGWGIDVPGDKSQKIWCWFDALINYISALGYGKDQKKLQEWWGDNLYKAHVVGKDVLKFHAIYWPAMLLSAGLPLPSTIFIHGFLMIDGGKMSKTTGNIVDPFFLIKKYGVDAVRYFLLREMPLAKDGDFSIAKFEEHYNSDLASGLGNLLSRIIPLAQKTKASPELSNENAREAIGEVEKSFQKAIEGFNFREALNLVWSLIAFCDQYIEQEELWKETEKKTKVVNNILFVLQKISTLLSPFLPQSAIKIQQCLKEGKVGKPLFPKIN